VFVDCDPVGIKAHRFLGIALHASIEPHSSGANQFRGLRARAITQLRKRAGQASSPDFSLERHGIMLIDAHAAPHAHGWS
jgi:hypothetical protein